MPKEHIDEKIEFLEMMDSSLYNNSRAIVRGWMEKAEKGNYYWRKLEALGFDGDYIAGVDDGCDPPNYSEDNQ